MKQVRMQAVLSLAILVACCACAFALDPSLDISQYAHTAWKNRDGFTRGAIYSMAQTPDGYLWLGTEFGLVRFDGVGAVPWQPPDNQHLPPGPIYSLLVARDGTLWIGAKGLASWKEGKLTRYVELAEQFVFALREDGNGTIWVGSAARPYGRVCAIWSGGIHCYGDDGRFGVGVFGLYEDSKGSLWAGVPNALWRWKPNAPKFYPMPGETNGVQAIGEDANGVLLIGRKGGIYKFIDGKPQSPLLSGISRQFRARRILRDRDGGLWIGTWNHGIVHVHQGRTDVFSAVDGLSGDDVQSLFEDREGNIWVSTLDGLDRFRDFAVSTFRVKQGLSRNLVGSVLADKDGSVWLGTYGGLNRWDRGQITIPHTRIVKRGEGLNGLQPQSLFQDDQGRVWISTSRELGYLEDGRFTLIKEVSDGQILSIVQDTARNIWFINEPLGLVRISPQNDVRQIPWSSLGHKDNASVLAVDRKRGGLWIGFYLGGVTYFSDGQVRESYTASDGLGAGRVADFQFDQDGVLWISTEGGLSRLKNNRVATLTSKNGLPCDTVHWSIKDDDDSFWLYTACGLVRIARSELDAWSAAADKQENTTRRIQVTVFDNSDGVRSLSSPGHYHPQVTKTPDEKLWFLPWDGVSVIDPHHIPFNKVPPPVHIEQIIADRKTYDTGSDTTGSLRLPPLIRDVEIDYTALSLVAPEKIRFRYKLEGLDRDWHEVGNRRQAYYTDLPPRHYRFRVAACNNSGVWNEAGAFLDLSVAPTYYQTNWFRALSVAAFLTLVWVLYRLRIQQVRRQERKLRDVIETMPTFAWTTLPDGSVDFVNRHWQEYTGLSTESTVGSGWEAAVHPEDLKRHGEKWRASVATGERFENEVRYRRATDGQYRWFLARAVPQRDARGNILKWYGISTDIEDRKRAEQLQADLAHVNRVSTMGELTASLAHEIKQPIGAAVANAEACARFLDRDQPDVPEAREAALEMAKDARRAAHIIDRVRSLYRKGSSQIDTVDVNEVISEMLLLLHNEANRHSVSMRTALADGLPRVMADRVQLQQVLMNLMLNGIQAMAETGGVLTINAQLDQGGRVLISVSDTGVGFPAEKAEQIFEAFFTTKPEGSGMGLAISRSIIDSHGGRLWATPNDGRGATFHFTLPTTTEVLQEAATGT
jgi:PAS domain S-box-containing protein